VSSHPRPLIAWLTFVGSATGAGDTFVAGVLFGLLCRAGDWATWETLRFAVDLATAKVQIDGFAGLADMMPRLSAKSGEPT
jgi:ketohexokinase